MYKKLIKNSLILVFSIFWIGYNHTLAHSQFEIKNEEEIDFKNKIETKSRKDNNLSLQEKFEKDFENFQSFEESVKPSNQFLNLFGIGGFADQRLKNSSFNLWDTFEKEMLNQIGKKKISGPDIDNTYNGSLKTLGD